MAALPDVVPDERTGDSTNTLGLQTYTFAFGATSDLGYASALGWMLPIVAVILAVVNLRILRSRQ